MERAALAAFECQLLNLSQSFFKILLDVIGECFERIRTHSEVAIEGKLKSSPSHGPRREGWIDFRLLFVSQTQICDFIVGARLGFQWAACHG